MAVVLGGYSGGGGGGATGSTGGYQSPYAQSRPMISQNVPGGNMPVIKPPPAGASPGGQVGIASAYGSQSPSGGFASSMQDSINAFQSQVAGLPQGVGGGGGGSGGGGGGGGGSYRTAISNILGSAGDRVAQEAQALMLSDAKWNLKQKKGLESERKAALGTLGDSFGNLVNNYNTAYAEAKQSNEDRYNQMLGIADSTTGQRQADINSAYNQQESDSMQRLAGLGMQNTTVAPTMGMGINRERQSALNRAADEMQQTKLGIIGSRTDDYPDLASMQSIIGGTGGALGSGGLQAMIAALGQVRS